MLASAVAQFLHAETLVVYDPSGVSGDVFIDVQPDQPDEAVTLRVTGGQAPDGIHPYDRLRLQVFVRGTQDPRTAHDRTFAIYDVLQGLSTVELPGGVWLVSCFAAGYPGMLSRDESGRVRYSSNYEVEVRHETLNRQGW